MSAIPRGLYMGGTELLDSNDRETTIAAGDDSSFNGFADSDDDADIPYENPQTGQRSRKRQHSPSTQVGESGKRIKIPGGRPAINKKVTEDPDSDDRRILELKDQGYSDEFICNKLADEGRIRYQKGTVNSRVLRFRKVLEKKADDKLDDELSDWHEGEDDKLEQSIQAIDEKFKGEMQKLVDKKWKDVSVTLANLLPDEKKKYTAKACKERWDALQDGTALKPIELDSDQEGRRKMRESRITEAKRLRAKAKEEAKRAKQAEEDAKTDKKRKETLKIHEKREAQQARAAEKAETQRIRAERNAGKVEKQAARKQAQKDWKAGIEAKRRIKELEERVYRSITGKALNRMRRASGNEGVNKDDTPADSDDESVHDADDEDEELDELAYVVSNREEAQDELADLVSDREEDQFPDGDSDDDDILSNIDVTPAKPLPKFKVRIATLENPRSVMTDEEIRVLLHERGLPRLGSDESHPQVVARLAAADNDLSSMAVSSLLKKYFDNKKGNKEAKIRRLQEYDAANSAAGMRGVKSTDLEFKRGYKGYGGRFGGSICD